MKQGKGGIVMDHNVTDEQLEAFLAKRTVPEVRSNLAYRIIEASRDVPQEKPRSAGVVAQLREVGCGFLKGVAGILDHVVLPQPAFAMAVVVIMMGGAALGAGDLVLDGTSLLLSDNNNNEIETFIMATDSFEYGEFL